jgi:multiple sugar transport system permease protein
MNRRSAFRFALMAGPALAGFLLFHALPAAEVFWGSLHRIELDAATRWVGLANYGYLLRHDPAFWPSVKVTLLYAACAVPLAMALSMGAALLVWGAGGRWLRGIYFLPAVLPPVASTAIWVWVLHPQNGLLNRMLALAGIAGPAWTQSVDWALPSVVLVGLWGFGGSMVVLLAGLDQMPRDLHEAAAIDGAGRLARLRHVTLPHLAPFLAFNGVMELIGAVRIFDSAFTFGVASGNGIGGPARATLFYGLNVYLKAFGYFHFGLACALACLLAAASGLATWGAIAAWRRLSRKGGAGDAA